MPPISDWRAQSPVEPGHSAEPDADMSLAAGCTNDGSGYQPTIWIGTGRRVIPIYWGQWGDELATKAWVEPFGATGNIGSIATDANCNVYAYDKTSNRLEAISNPLLTEPHEVTYGWIGMSLPTPAPGQKVTALAESPWPTSDLFMASRYLPTGPATNQEDETNWPYYGKPGQLRRITANGPTDGYFPGS